MRAAGVNAIKLYAGNPGLNAGAPGSAGNWKQFLDACYNGGSNPIYVVMFSYVQGDVIAAGGAAYQQYITDYQNLVGSTVDTSCNPRILRWQRDLWRRRDIQPSILGQLRRPAQRCEGCRPIAGSHTISHDRHQRQLHTRADAWPAIKQGEDVRSARTA